MVVSLDKPMPTISKNLGQPACNLDSSLLLARDLMLLTFQPAAHRTIEASNSELFGL